MEEILKAIQAQNQAMQAQTQALQDQNQETREALQAQNQETREALNEALQAQNKELKESLGLKFQCLEDEISAVKEDVSFVKEDISSVKEEMKEELASLKERLAAVETGHPRTPVFQQENNNSGRPLVKVPTFDGQSSWTSFKTQFDVVAQANGWNVRDKASFLAAALRGPAVDVLQMIPEQLRLDFNSLIDTLDSRYGEEHYQQLHVVKFKNRLQEKKESLQDLANDIRRLARLAFPTCPSETQYFMAQQQFIDAIGDPETQKFARLSSATTLQETLVQAMKHEAAQQASRGSYRVARQVKLDNPGREKGRCWTCGANDHLSPTCPRKVKQRSDTGCWKCGKDGHIRKNCPDNSKKPSAPKKNQENYEYLRNTENGLLLRGFINGRSCDLVIDTGANVTLVRTDVFQNLYPKPVEVRMKPISLQTATGERAKVHHCVLLSIQIGSKIFQHKGYVADIMDECIIGLDVLRQFGLSIDIGRNLLRTSDEDIPLLTSQQLHNFQSCRVLALEETQVPPRSECVIKGQLETTKVIPKFAILEGDSEAPSRGNLVAKELIDTGRDVIPVRVVNLYEYARAIKKGSCLGNAEPVVLIKRNHPVMQKSKRADNVPDHLQQVWEETKKELQPGQQRELATLLATYNNIFAKSSEDYGRTDLTKHRINTDESNPIKQAPHRIPLARRQEAETLVKEMLDQNIIEPSSSPWVSPVVLVKKKDGSTRFCVDYRKLNDVTKKDSYPFPRIDATLDTLAGSQWFSTLDLKSGYWQVEMHPDDKEKTAFTTGSGLWQFNVMPFGLCNAPATFERLMEAVLQGLATETCMVYLDDIVVLGKNFEEHLSNIEKVFKRLEAANLKLSPKKCKLFKKEVAYLGHIISAEGFSNIARPLHRLTESGRPFVWTPDCQRAMEKLKEMLVAAPILAYPRPGDSFILDTDASNTGIGGVLSQVQEGSERVIAYFSKTLSKPERNYCVTRKELLAIVKSIEHFHHYLYGQEFILRSDHASLQWLLNFKNPEGQLARWIQRLQEYQVKIQHRPGKRHQNADALSRRPCIPQCGHCARAEDKYGVRQVTVQESDEVEEQHWTRQALRKAQREDRDILPMINWKESDEKPSWEDVAPYSPKTKSLWSLWNSLTLRDGVLYRKWESEDGKHESWKLVLPRSHVPLALQEMHSSPTGGHFGIRKTLAKARERFCWPESRADVEKWCRNCTQCSARKGPTTRSKGKLKIYNVGAPFERIAIDVAGPFPKSDLGNKYILVIMDYFTKWPVAVPIPDQEASTVSEALLQDWVCIFGVPRILHSDQGRNFESNIFQELCRRLGIEKTRTTPLHPQSDGMVERFNRTLTQHLTMFVDKNQRDWDQHLPMLLMAYRSAEHESTGYSPARMLFGHELRMPCDVLLGRPEETFENTNEYISHLEERMLSIHQWAREKLHFSSEKMKDRYNVKTSHKTFKEGEMVWLHNPQRKKELSPKLQYHWEGPYKIIKCLNDVIYRIQKTRTSKPKVVHYNRLAPFRGSVPEQWTVRDDQDEELMPGGRRTKLRGVLQASCCLKRSDCCLPPTPVYFLEDSRRFYELLSPVLLLLSLTVLQLKMEREEALERLKKKRTILRTSLSKYGKRIEEYDVHKECDHEELLGQLSDVYEELRRVDEEIGKLIDIKDLEKDLKMVEEYREKAVAWKYLLKKRSLVVAEGMQRETATATKKEYPGEIGRPTLTGMVKLPKLTMDMWICDGSSLEIGMSEKPSVVGVTLMKGVDPASIKEDAEMVVSSEQMVKEPSKQIAVEESNKAQVVRERCAEDGEKAQVKKKSVVEVDESNRAEVEKESVEADKEKVLDVEQGMDSKNTEEVKLLYVKQGTDLRMAERPYAEQGNEPKEDGVQDSEDEPKGDGVKDSEAETKDNEVEDSGTAIEACESVSNSKAVAEGADQVEIADGEAESIDDIEERVVRIPASSKLMEAGQIGDAEFKVKGYYLPDRPGKRSVLLSLSNYYKILRVTAWMNRFLTNARGTIGQRVKGDLTVNEIKRAELMLVRVIQRESFTGPEDKRLKDFKLCCDSLGLLRVKTKISRRQDLERLIGLLKQLLRKILGQARLEFEELYTIICDTESLMNSRTLTPALFLHDLKEIGVPDLDSIERASLQKRYQFRQRLREDLRKRFRTEYFGFLRQETRRRSKTRPIKVGDLVLIGQDNAKRVNWPLARVVEVYPGRDGPVRVAKLRTSKGVQIRPVQRLYNLEIPADLGSTLRSIQSEPRRGGSRGEANDLLIYADTIQEHNKKLKGILEKAKEKNIKFDLTKAQICLTKVRFLGHVISQNGIDPEPNKIDKLITFKRPEDKKSLQRIMGLYNYLGKFIPNLAASTSNIRGILRKNVVWHWGPKQDGEFDHIKECVRNAPSLAHFDKSKMLILQCDASKDAMGAALLQEDRPLAFASASFSDSQKQYSQIEKELLSVYYGCKKFEYLLSGHTFVVQTDHQPLLPLVKKPLSDISPRLQRLVMKLIAFDFKLQYKPGKYLIVADTLSRDTHPMDELPTPFLEDKRMVKMVRVNISDEKTGSDAERYPRGSCFGSAIVIPKTQRNAMLNLLHQSHQGISAIQGLARESLFWPRMSIDIAEKVKNCEICQKHQKSKIRQPLKPFPVPDYPWQTVSLDIFYIQKKPHLLVVDRYSGYPEVFTLDPPTAINVKNKLRETFARFGIPETMMSDNGPPFRSEIMTDFCIRWGIKQLFSSPHLHRSNGLAERNIQTIKNQLIKCRDEGSDPYLAILAYRNTPKNDLPSPAQLCLSRSLRCQIPRITPLYRPYQTNWRSIENAKRKRQSSMKEQYDRNSKSYPKVNVGEDAWCQIHPRETWTPVKISAQADSPQSFEVVTPSGNRLIRNQQFIRPRDGGYEKSQLSSEPITASPEAQHPQCYSPTMGESSTAPIQRSSEETNIDQREGATTSAGIAPEPSGRPRFS
ncbi:K02A2.6-like, partial [Cordylochernes scorpioides]